MAAKALPQADRTDGGEKARFDIQSVPFSVLYWKESMNTLTAAELKRRGMAAIEERLRRGPVHLVKRNKAAAVVLTEQQYAELSQAKSSSAPAGMTAVQWLLSQPASGRKSKRQLQRELREERDSWA